jgi:glycosyltransferase involved in cell wall biosynthesis
MAAFYALFTGQTMKIRVLYTIPNFNTAGSGKALLNLALGLNPDTFEAHIACQNDSGAFFEIVKNSGIPVHVFDYIPKSRPITTMFSESWKVSRQFKKINPDVIHSFHYSDNYTEGLAARLAGIKWVFTKKNMSWGGSSGKGWQLRSAMASAIAVQNTDMQKQFYPNSKKTTLIPRGVNVANFTAQVPQAAVREAMQTPSDARIMICVANMVPVKGVELLIEAFSSLSAAHPEWHLWLVGDIKSDYGNALIAQAKQSEASSKIHFSGKQANVRQYLDHAEIFVLPTKDEGRREGSPVALLEAMANGKVVIGSGVPGVKDQLQKFPENQFESGNRQNLKIKLGALMQNSKAENKVLGHVFHEHVANYYTIQQEIERHEAFYLKLLNDK